MQALPVTLKCLTQSRTSPGNDQSRHHAHQCLNQTISGSRSLDSTVTVAVSTTLLPGIVSYPTATTWSCAISNLIEGTNDITVTATAPDNQTAVAQTSIT